MAGRSSFSIELTGAREMAQALRRTGKDAREELKTALRDEAREILRESQRDFVPVDSGALRASGRVGKVTERGNDLEVKLGFGSGPSREYALSVHEHPSGHSPPSWKGKGITDIRSVRSRTPWNVASGRGPKFLSRPLLRAVRSGRMRRRFLKALRRLGK